ncbi:unnamed protein product, partial [Didymodactylos carnosus]
IYNILMAPVETILNEKKEEEQLSTNPHPYYRSWWFSKLHHSWISELLNLGSKKTIEANDLYDLLPENESRLLTDSLEQSWKLEVNASLEKNRSPSLFRVLIRTFGRKMLLYGLYLTVLECLRIIQPLLLAHMLSYFKQCSVISTTEAWLLAFVLCLIAWISVTVRQTFFDNTHKLGLRVFIAHSGLIYRK